MRDPKSTVPETSAPVFLEELVARAEASGASDVHLQMRPGLAQILFRLDGVLTDITTIPAELAERVFGRIKFLSRLKTYQESLPQDGRIDKSALNSRHDIRVSTYPTVTGEKIVLRLFQLGRATALGELGLPEDCVEALKKSLRLNSGFILLTGPAGSGKTSTIYASLRHLLATAGRHIITVEDPVEQIIPGLMQTEINETRGLTFAEAARHLLRQDPQVLVIGEIRDQETANIALRAALTGHLVISTLHAGSCRGVFERLQVLCTDHSAVASAVELVINQRLLRRSCAQCAGKGCASCSQTGYHGRVIAAEWFQPSQASRQLIRQQRFEEITPARPLELYARELVRDGITNETEYERLFGV